jgi:HlyD family secretion protein
MKPFTRAALLGALSLIAACQKNGEPVYPGYAEGEYVRIAAPFAGSLSLLNVKRGEQVATGAALFALEQENEKAARDEAQARVAHAEAQLENLRKGRRPDEVDAVRAQLAQAEAALKLSVADYRRQEQLVARGFISPAQLDGARAAQERDRARVAELGAQIRVAQLAGRSDEIASASADLKAAREQLAQADWKLAQKSQRAPGAALVADTLYTQGEWVQAGMPVVSLLPAGNVKVKFFVPESRLSAITIGQAVQLSCDGCAPLSAQVSFISPQAEYTSPLIYSKENRASLVYLVEARAKSGEMLALHPGQPVEVRF